MRSTNNFPYNAISCSNWVTTSDQNYLLMSPPGTKLHCHRSVTWSFSFHENILRKTCHQKSNRWILNVSFQFPFLIVLHFWFNRKTVFPKVINMFVFPLKSDQLFPTNSFVAAGYEDKQFLWDSLVLFLIAMILSFHFSLNFLGSLMCVFQ